MDAYLSVKLAHIVSSTLLLGTGLGSAFYMWRAHRSGDVRHIARITQSVVLADWVFTTPVVVLQPLTGFWMLAKLGYGMDLLWVRWSIGLFVLAGACWLPVVWLQIRARELSNHALQNGSELPPRYYRYMGIWFILGWPAFIAVAAIFFLMVFKPL